ncbi:MAG: hypothetical protein RBR53_03755 [Desulforegulaceae bacterium]|nr:hypothetical protein [Desulforegulaceae bacterium]
MTAELPKQPDCSKLEQLLVNQKITSQKEIKTAKSAAFLFNKRASTPVCLILAEENQLKKSDITKLLTSKPVYKEAVELIKNDKSLDQNKTSSYISKNNNILKLLNELTNNNIISLNKRNLLLNKVLNLKTAAKTLASMGLLFEDSLEAAFRKQKKKISFCEILYEQHLVTLSELNHIFIKLDNSLKLGGILSNLGLIDEKTLSNTLKEQSKSGLSFGSILVNQKKISIQQLYFALSIQYNIPFRQLSNFTYSDSQKIELRGIVDRKIAEQNFIIPILLTYNNLMIGVFNPSHVADINDIISKYSDLKISCVLITHNKFEQLYALLYGEILNTTNDLIAGHSHTYTPGKKTVISQPDSQYRLINDLFEKYLKLIKDKNLNPDRKVFHDFIRENYFKICSEYDCSNVSFWFEFPNNNLKIMASPVLSKNQTD